jgi:hypothetical protein
MRRCPISDQLPLEPVQLTPPEVKSLRQLIQAHRTPQAIARRARIILGVNSHPSWSSKQLARLLKLNDRLIRKWRQRWLESHSLKDAPRKGAPRRFSSPVRAQVTALACSSLPRSHGVPLSRWSRAELARQVSSIPTLPTISAGTVGRWLAAEKIRPWQYHSWQHIQNPEEFLQRARPVLQLYEQATVLLEQGIWVVCTDEKTSIQARQAEQAPRPAIREHPIYPSPRYTRRGAINLMAALSVADGLVYGQCYQHKRFVDFRSFLETALLPEAHHRGVHQVALILDNGTTHASKQLPRWVSELAAKPKEKLTVQLYWLPVNASWLDQIEIWFSILQRKLLQPNHFASLKELERTILDFIACYNQVAEPLKWSYTVEKLEHKLAPRLRQNVLLAGT